MLDFTQLGAPTSLSSQETHKIGSWPKNRTLAASDGRGWRNLHASLITVDSWAGVLQPTGHPCLGYCVHRPAQLKRRIGKTGTIDSGVVRPRQFLLIPGLVATEWHRYGCSDMLTLYIRQELLDAVASEAAGRTIRNAVIDLDLGATDPLIEQIALALLAAIQRPEDGSSALYADSLAYSLAAHLTLGYTPRHGDQRLKEDRALRCRGLDKIPDLIEAHLGEDLSIEFLARETGVSPKAFARAFVRRFRTTPHRFVLDRRLERAKQLLVNTDASIVDIALQTGFSSQSHMATAFRRMTGMTPKAYRST